MLALLALAGRFLLPFFQNPVKSRQEELENFAGKIQSARLAQVEIGSRLAAERKAVGEAYAALKEKRGKLNSADPASVQAYNEEAADYERRNKDLGALQKEFEAADGVLADLMEKRSAVAGEIARSRVLTFYSVEWCGYCKQARAYLVLNNIPFREYDVEEDLNAYREFKDLGGSGYPFFAINGETCAGFDPEWIQERVKGPR